ncbi:hypothetical protein EGM88_09195 [Aureibaculum marinum]|uniref:Lipoprotein n=1 Tax=Aureibaculum marinum TaxID=2487930 RepID=A0A3N4NJF3_9FLAO|nr:hypothetical protein [Aureibaculum marinum]RPD96532.1 hypothetical protein EGM88_09195 [Aureibaculum marinum]
MIKKVFLTFLVAVTLVSCSLDDDNDSNLVLKTLPIKSYVVPDEFELGMSYTLKVEYDLPNSCHSFYNLYYDYDGSSRIVAITSLFDTEGTCTDTVVTKEYEFVITVEQMEDYTFRFWKGKDDEDNDIFEDVTVPVVE